MARNKGTFKFAANFEVKAAEALDPRLVVENKSELIQSNTWPSDGDTLYIYEGMVVGVSKERAVYMLIDKANALNSDYSGWYKIGSGGGSSLDIVDNLTTDDANKALSARQGKVLNEKISKLSSIYSFKGKVDSVDKLPSSNNSNGDVYYVGDQSFVWNGVEWIEMPLPIDLSSYYTISEVDQKVDELREAIEENAQLAAQAKTQSDTNKSNLDEVDIRVNTLSSKLTEAEVKIEELDSKIGTSGGGSIDPEIQNKVNDHDNRIGNLELVVGDSSKGLVKGMNTLNGDSEVEGSVDNKIANAFKWVTLS